MTETAPHYIADTRFAAKLQELVNEHSIENLGQAERSMGFREDLELLYMEHNSEWLDSVHLDFFVSNREERIEQAKNTKKCAARGVRLSNYLTIPHAPTLNAIFEDFSTFWDHGDPKEAEVIPASRSFQRAKRECKATRFGI